MGSSRLLLLFYPTLIQLLVVTIAQPIPPLFYFCNNNGNFTANSTYSSNLDRILTSLSSNTKISSGFYNDSIGQNTDKVNAIALCRGDTKPEICRSCIGNSSLALKQLCPNQKEAITWYDNCMLRYSNRSLFGSMEINPSFVMWNVNNVSQVTQFNRVLKTLLDSLVTQVASGDSLRKFATGNARTTSNQTIYALAQCTPDLSKQNCSDCLAKATGIIPQCCDGKQGARVGTPSCNFRYEIELFYDSAAETLPPSPSPAPAPLPSSSSPPLAPPPLPSSSSPPLAPQPPTGRASLIGKASNIAAGGFIATLLLVLL
ncbi:hypothetical protein JCGZ_21284 [Jatropha curcas]|uniref:Gnk2-homologous domain-containing protein n=1 Tax=Jatropha curcas TaxID=180498 RepID=A0A067JDJ2_JATCU|nr:hypothetical protein JCGZ_21284 [Jatropha curcas]